MISKKILSSVYDLKYPKQELNKLQVFFRFVKKQLNNIDVDLYLFGSYANGKIKDTSYIDIVLISKEDIDIHQLQEIKINLILDIDECLNMNYGQDFDIKIYTEEKFIECLEKGSVFETSINSYMYKII